MLEASTIWHQQKLGWGHYKAFQRLNIYNAGQVGKCFNQITEIGSSLKADTTILAGAMDTATPAVDHFQCLPEKPLELVHSEMQDACTLTT